MKKNEPLKMDKRKFSDLVKVLEERIPHYTPQWQASDKNDPGVALIKIFAYLNEMLIHHYNQIPDKNFIAFLNMLGIKLLPAQSSKVPLTFTLAEGTDKEIFIPERTQASADENDQHKEFAFESEKNLLAIHSKLMKAISVDPKEDTIYLSPPKFLEEEEKEVKRRQQYKLVSSVKIDDIKLQLDHVTDLEAGDFLKIASGNSCDYCIISKIAGNIVILTDTVAHPYPIETKVEKVRDFTLYESKNVQEHILYIGQQDLFNVKSKAEFIFVVSHTKGVPNSTPLKIIWEYWGEKEGEKEENWHHVQVQNDTTNGLSTSGEITLAKVTKGEIKEKEINHTKSRWIRCRVDEPLPVDEVRTLPSFEDIMFSVKSAGEDLLPDLAFNNDIPLDVKKSFKPFGKEPRIYETFSIANKEIFSKKGANVTLDVDIAAMLGAPAAIEVTNQEKIKVFAIDRGGRLLELEVDPYDANKVSSWIDHGFPPGMRLASKSIPNAICIQDNILVCARTENGQLVARYYDGSKWTWDNLKVPKNGVTVKYDPIVIFYNNGTSSPAFTSTASANSIPISIYFTGSNGSLYEFYNRTWKEHKSPPGVALDSAPQAIRYGNYGNVKIFVKGENGNLYALDVTMSKATNPNTWEDLHCPNPNKHIKVDSKPFAFIDDNNGSLISIFVKGTDGHLWEYNSTGWSHLKSPDNLLIDSDPHGYMQNSQAHIFVRCADNSLWEWTDGSWNPHSSPLNSNLCLSPFTMLDVNEDPFIFTTNKQNGITELKINNNGPDEWKTHNSFHNQLSLNPTLSWEYWNKKGWVVLHGLEDQTSNLLNSGLITFEVPNDIAETDVSGQKSYWIRARLIGGDYGKETFSQLLIQQETAPMRSASAIQIQPQLKLISDKSVINPPIINHLTIAYEYRSNQLPQHCLAYNNLTFIDHTEAAITPYKHFDPFLQLEDHDKTIYLGFEKYFHGSPVKIFFDAEELPFSESKKPKVAWSYRSENSWEELSYRDDTEGFIKTDILQFLMPMDLSGYLKFGQYLYWMKGEHVEGKYDKFPKLRGIYPNTTWALQSETIKDEIIGSSNGEPTQTFTFSKFPVLEGEEVRVREVLTEEEKNFIRDHDGEDAVYEIKDEKGDILEVWVLWKERPDFFDSSENHRHYTLDRAVGEIGFGDGKHGKIPPVGDDNIKAFSYQYGGGKGGNVHAKEIQTLKSSVAGVDKVTNPIAADGGADTATIDQMLHIGPTMISHRNRAVTVEDFEWLSKQASRKVAKARCLPAIDNNNRKKAGFVTVIIIPDSTEAEPKPSLALKRVVKSYLKEHSLNTVSNADNIYVKAPRYTRISLFADIFVRSMDVASSTETEVKTKLNAFFHPLTGGSEGKGWEFGRDVAVSDIYALLEPIEGVDHIENVRFSYDGLLKEKDVVSINDDFIVANGKHNVNIKLRQGG